MKYNVIGAALLGGLLATGSAEAATATCSFKNQDTVYTVSLSGSSECRTGNDTNSIDAESEFFGLTGWMLADKNDDATSGDQNLTFGDLGPVNGTLGGGWSILNPDNYSEVFMTLKSGNTFAAFLLDAATVMSGTWASTRELSHASIYYRGEPNPAPVPVPAAGFLLLGALGALALRRRKTS